MNNDQQGEAGGKRGMLNSNDSGLIAVGCCHTLFNGLSELTKYTELDAISFKSSLK